MYEIRNISRYLKIAGLYPGETKKIPVLDDNLMHLSNQNLILIRKIVETKRKAKEEEEISNSTRNEVIDTNGRN